ALREARQIVDREHAALVSRQQAVLAAHREIAAREQALAERTNEQRQLLAKVNAALAHQEEELEDLEADSRSVQEAIQRELMKRRLHPAGYRTLPRFTGLSLPAGRIGSGFGMRFHPIKHRMIMHTGVDIGLPYGAPIHAAAAGDVIYAALRGGYGKCIIIL